MSTTSYLARRVENNHENMQAAELTTQMSPNEVKAKAYLMHHGVKGQKWGVQHGPPYPLGSDVSTGSSLKTNSSERVKGGAAKTTSSKKSNSSSLIEKYKQHKVDKANKIKMEKVREAKAKKAAAKKAEDERALIAKQKEEESKKLSEQRQTQINNAIKVGDKNELRRLATDMTDAQLDEAVNRMKKLSDLYEKTYIPPEPKKIEKAKEFVNKSATWISEDAPKYIKSYNTIANVVNSINESNTLPVINLDNRNYDNNNNNNNSKQASSPAIEALIRSGNKEAINKYASQMTDDELNRAVNRMSNMNKINGNNSNNNNQSQQQTQNNKSSNKLSSADKKASSVDFNGDTATEKSTYGGPNYSSNSTSQKKSSKDYTEKYTIVAPKTSTKDYKKAVNDYNNSIKSGTMEDLYAAAGRLAQAKESDNAAWEKTEQKRVDDLLKQIEKKQKSTYTGPKYS